MSVIYKILIALLCIVAAVSIIYTFSIMTYAVIEAMPGGLSCDRVNNIMRTFVDKPPTSASLIENLNRLRSVIKELPYIEPIHKIFIEKESVSGIVLLKDTMKAAVAPLVFYLIIQVFSGAYANHRFGYILIFTCCTVFSQYSGLISAELLYTCLPKYFVPAALIVILLSVVLLSLMVYSHCRKDIARLKSWRLIIDTFKDVFTGFVDSAAMYLSGIAVFDLINRYIHDSDSLMILYFIGGLFVFISYNTVKYCLGLGVTDLKKVKEFWDYKQTSTK